MAGVRETVASTVLSMTVLWSRIDQKGLRVCGALAAGALLTKMERGYLLPHASKSIEQILEDSPIPL